MFYNSIIFLVLLGIIALPIYFYRKRKKPTILVGDGGSHVIPVPVQKNFVHTISYNTGEVWDKTPLQNWWIVYNTSEKLKQYKRVDRLITSSTKSKLSKVSLCASQIIGWAKTEGGVYMTPEVDSSIVVKRTTKQC